MVNQGWTNIQEPRFGAGLWQPAALGAESAVEQADAFIKTGKADQPEKQSIDCELINAQNADQYGVFAKK